MSTEKQVRATLTDLRDAVRWRTRRLRRWCHEYAESQVRRANRRRFKIDRQAIANAFTQCRCDRSDLVMVHSSLSACGLIQGGAQTVVEMISERANSVCVPTHSYCYPPNAAEIGPVFDIATSPSLVGAISEFVRVMEGSHRSLHPTHAVSMVGESADEIVARHELCETPCGRGTPYESLVNREASVLMFGATMNTYTLFHTAEDAAGCDYLYEKQRYNLRARSRNGQVHEISMLKQDMSILRRFAEMDVELEKAGLLRRCRLGLGEILFIPNSLQVHEYLLDRIEHNPLHLVSESARESLRHLS